MVLRRSRKRQRFKQNLIRSSQSTLDRNIIQQSTTRCVTALRRLTLFAKHLPEDPKHIVPWWIESLQWIGITPMQLSFAQISRKALLSFMTEHPLPKQHPLLGKPIVGYVPVACTSVLALPLTSLLAESSYVYNHDSKFNGQCHFTQAKLESVEILIQPIPHVKNLGGMICAALTSVNDEQFKDDYLVRKRESQTFQDLIKTPGMILKSAETPTRLTYVPKESEPLFKWSQFGIKSYDPLKITANLYLSIGYSNLAIDYLDVNNAYNLTTCMFDVTIKSNVYLRDYQDVRCYVNPIHMVDPTVINDQTSGRNIFYKRFYNHHGLQLRALKN